MDRKSKINRIYILAIVLLIFIGCGQENEEHTVPMTYVSFTIVLQDPEYMELNAPGNRIFVNGGYNNHGIVIYRASFYDFKAYDRTCTFNIEANCRVDGSTTSGVLVKCSCCGSEYELASGSATKGPSGIPLKEYKTYYNEAAGTLSVRN